MFFRPLNIGIVVGSGSSDVEVRVLDCWLTGVSSTRAFGRTTMGR
jgi:hypothetical protein